MLGQRRKSKMNYAMGSGDSYAIAGSNNGLPCCVILPNFSNIWDLCCKIFCRVSVRQIWEVSTSWHWLCHTQQQLPTEATSVAPTHPLPKPHYASPIHTYVKYQPAFSPAYSMGVTSKYVVARLLRVHTGVSFSLQWRLNTPERLFHTRWQFRLQLSA